ncbi:MAG: hypothetical protein LCH82_02615 [Actinobacteria bacterium]|nr:hypothetical protein [Actinomycetota bacterium]
MSEAMHEAMTDQTTALNACDCPNCQVGCSCNDCECTDCTCPRCSLDQDEELED